MLPNLGQLSLHDEAETGGFYEPSPAEQAAMNDDPVTFEKPLYTMSFRVRLPQNNADGSPRYKSFAPLELWTWIKSNNSLPAREGPVWYEDWWALCNTFNPTHQNIPAWAHRLERYDQYALRMAREAAAREVRRGAQRATDKLISWRFWLQGTRDEGRMQRALDFMRTRFGTFMRANFSREAVDDWSSRLLLSVGVRDLVLSDAEPGATFPALWVDCHVFVPPPYAGSFESVVTNEMSEWEYGVGSAMRRMFGVIGAWSRGPLDPTDGVFNRGSWRDLPDAPVQTLTPPTVTRSDYVRWRGWAVENEPVLIIPGRPGPQAETDWAVEWRFWLKGELPEEYMFMGSRMREWFRLYMRSFNNSNYDYGKRLHLHMVKKNLRLVGAPLATARGAFVIQVDVQLYMPSLVFARDFVRRIDHLRDWASGQGHSYEHAMHVLFGIKGAMKWAYVDKPVVRDNHASGTDGRLVRSKRMGLYPVVQAVAPVLSRDQYEQWATFSHAPYNADQRYAMDQEVRAGGEKRVRWRFWLKGEMTQEERLANAIWMRRAFARYMVQHPIPRSVYYGAGSFDDDMRWFRRTRATIFQETQTITNDQGSSFTVYPVRCEFEIYFDRPRASAFVQWASRLPLSWEHMAEDWAGFSPIRAWAIWDRPQQLDNEDPHDDTHDLMTGVPTESVEAWNAWDNWRRERRPAE